MLKLKFTEADCDTAYRTWGANCGPTALAAILGMTLGEVKPHVEAAGFAGKGYMSPTMMKTALAHAGATIHQQPNKDFPNSGLARIQWEGPWTEPGANPKWSYWFTHWVASWDTDRGVVIFDVNCGLQSLEVWKNNVAPVIAKSIKRASGGWHITHAWEIVK